MALPDLPPFSLRKAEKEKLLNRHLNALSRYHYARCDAYRKIMDCAGFNVHKNHPYTDLIFLPVRLFKMMELRSCPQEKIVNALTSSGTSGQGKSMVYLDKETAIRQAFVLTRIISSFIGTKRLPMIIVDSENSLGHTGIMPANAAGILGFSILGSKKFFALDDNAELNTGGLLRFTEDYGKGQILVFGFTYKIYRFLVAELSEKRVHPDLSGAVLIHGGGWKRMEKEAVSREEFRQKLIRACGIHKVHEYYGMAEQSGSIFMECEHGHLHASLWSDVIIRRSLDFSVAERGEEGIIQVLSLLPASYPGHALLTEDKGVLLGEDDCKCGRFGKYFQISGRLENAEIKGCSDAYEEHIF